MLGRRGFLGKLLLSPLAGAAAAEAAVNMTVSTLGGAVECEPIERDIDPTWSSDSKIRNDLERLIGRKRNHMHHGSLPAKFESKKSWSFVFKESEWRKEESQKMEIEQLLNDVMYSDYDPITRGLELAKIAKIIRAL